MKKTADKQCDVSRKKDTIYITLEGDLTIVRASALKEVLDKALHKGKRIEIKLEKCESADPSFLQLICSTHKTALSMDREVEIRGNIPDFLVTLIKCLGYKKNICNITADKSPCLWIMDEE